MKKQYVKVNDADCTLEVEFQRKVDDSWVLLVQIWAYRKAPEKSEMSFSLRLPESFLRDKVDPTLDRYFIELCCLLAIENHADALLTLAAGQKIGLMEAWIEAAAKVVRQAEDKEKLLLESVQFDDSLESFDTLLKRSVKRKNILE